MGHRKMFFLFTTGPRVWALQLPSVPNKGPSFQTPYGKQNKARVPIFQLPVNFFHKFIPDGPRLTKSLHLRGFPSSLRLFWPRDLSSWNSSAKSVADHSKCSLKGVINWLKATLYDHLYKVVPSNLSKLTYNLVNHGLW